MMDEREALIDQVAHILTGAVAGSCCARTGGYGRKDGGNCDCRDTAADVLDHLEAAGYRLPTTGELAAERRGWEAAAEALDHWGDQEDAAAITCPEADVTVHREREAAFYDAAARLRAAPRATAALGGRDDG